MGITREDKSIVWYVHCHTCGKDVDHCVNGSLMDAAAQNHLKEHPCHTVDVAYRYEGARIRLVDDQSADRAASLPPEHTAQSQTRGNRID